VPGRLALEPRHPVVPRDKLAVRRCAVEMHKSESGRRLGVEDVRAPVGHEAWVYVCIGHQQDGPDWRF
jgi:hypothetical protein